MKQLLGRFPDLTPMLRIPNGPSTSRRVWLPTSKSTLLAVAKLARVKTPSSAPLRYVLSSQQTAESPTLLQLFHIIFISKQDTVTGACNTTYSFGAADVKGRYSLIKQRTMSECTNVPRFSINLYGARNCAGKLQDEILATTQAYYQFSRTSSGSLKAHIISSLGYQVLQWHPPAGAPFYNLAKYVFTVLRTIRLFRN